MLTPELQTFIANLTRQARDGKDLWLGGGRFTPRELAIIVQQLQQMAKGGK
jgi:hypothetical protein